MLNPSLKYIELPYNLENSQERVLFDNHHGKEPHYHLDQDKKGIFFS
jgi:hypothetical protein